MKLTLAFVFAVLLCGIACSNKPAPATSTATAPAAETAPAIPEPPKYVPPPPPKKGHYQHVGFNGSFFRELKPGDIAGLEGGLMAMYAKDGVMWLVDAEPNDNYERLTKRPVYLARISGELVAKRCGVWLPDYKSAPSYCIEEERIVSWKAAKAFMISSASKPGDIREVEAFLTERSHN